VVSESHAKTRTCRTEGETDIHAYPSIFETNATTHVWLRIHPPGSSASHRWHVPGQLSEHMDKCQH